jgi:hypothetical protein
MNPFRPVASLLVCLGMTACSSQQNSVQQTRPSSDELKGWYVAAKDPLTFCPRGYSLQSDRKEYRGEYVYLTDRKTRFFIPPGKDNLACLKQALAAKNASMSDNKKITRSVSSQIARVGKVVCRTVVTGFVLTASMIGGAPADDSPADQMMKAVWDD